MYALGAISIIMVGVLGYYFRDRIMPKPSGTAPTPPAATRLELPSATDYGKLLNRPDFSALEPLTSTRLEFNREEPSPGIFRTKL